MFSFTDKKSLVAPGRRICVYGQSGVGKSTLATTFKDSILIDIGARLEPYVVKNEDDEVIGFIDNLRAKTDPVVSWDELLEGLQGMIEIFKKKPAKRPKTLIYDDLNGIATLLRDVTVATKGEESLGEWGGRKGREFMTSLFPDFLSLTQEIAILGINQLFVANAEVEKISLPGTEAFHAYNLPFLKEVNEFFNRQMDATLYCSEGDYFTKETKDGTKRKFADFERKVSLLAEPEARYVAIKNGLNLPKVMPLNGYVLQEEIKKAAGRHRELINSLETEEE